MAWEAKKFIEEKISQIKKIVGDKNAVVATSGGVDSVACAFLGHEALGEKLIVIFIDDGLMREGEPRKVSQEFGNLGVKVKIVDARDEFFKALKGIEDPEEKRKKFRDTFYKTLGKAIKENRASYLIQGTIAADVSETERGIKTQHNVLEQIGIDPGDYGFQVIEPLREIYKPEVRDVARELGLPEEIYQRMPFPGPGLATRVIGEVNPQRVEMVRKANRIVEEEIKELKPFQAFAVLMNDRATGMVGGKRVFGNIMVVRSVESKNAMTASVSKIPWEILEKIQQRITEEIPSVTKVLFDITPKPPSTIEYV
ncbi:glutamine-hydrolyzing GMP synthase subunit GuaA [bacterium]|nr:glutamine-hydrolyzing GMP synthase subunit GuaA [bacterium]NIN93060.1 glutamine-hydrolyzing GMP synthase subunit GuaA [bacterium]NIO18929.1 glutamine-hydrolyzing GMP synthase subunit GuaA [bacterium]NIO74010.1 glutamine-hydrolyzing GMP synthase subunit GuaA [bacterium]